MMAPTQTSNNSSLRDALYELSTEQHVPDAALLDDIVRRYPQYAAELTEFAIALAVDALHDAATESAESDTDDAPITVTPAVSRAMSRFHNRLHAVSKTETGPSEEQSLTDSGSVPVNPFEALGRSEFRDLASRLDVNNVFIIKLRDRQIDPSGIPESLSQQVADELKVPQDVVIAHLAAPPTVASMERQFYKSAEKPNVPKQQSFVEAVQSSGLSGAQQQRLLNLQ